MQRKMATTRVFPKHDFGAKSGKKNHRKPEYWKKTNISDGGSELPLSNDKNETPSSTKWNVKQKNRNKYMPQNRNGHKRHWNQQSRAQQQPMPRKYLLIKNTGKWFNEDSTFGNTIPPAAKPCSATVVKERLEFAEQLLKEDVAIYTTQRENSKKSNAVWLKTVLSSGTSSDKVAALTVTVQESPVHNLSNLDSLISMAKKKGKRECIMAIETLKELFISDLLPDDRKLKSFEQFPFANVGNNTHSNKDSQNRQLLLWYYEAQLKEKYLGFIQTLQVATHDTLLATKSVALNAIFNLLSSKPEQEQLLLSYFVNKVGDPNYKLASKAGHLLTKLVEAHPNMKMVVLLEVEKLMYRPNIHIRAQYYCICFLNQLVLSHDEKPLAIRLMEIYFTFFNAFVKKSDVESKLMSGLLTGVNRVYPYAKMKVDEIQGQMDTLYKLVHIVNFNTSMHALMLLYQVMESSQVVSDRYYVALYKKLLDPALKNSSCQAMFLNLLYKSMKSDLRDNRVKTFSKRLLQVCAYQSPTFICGSWILLSEILKSKPGTLSSLLQHNGKADADEITFTDDEDEHFVDAQQPESDDDDEKVTIQQHEQEKPSSWFHHRSGCKKEKKNTDYEPSQRNPLYCNVDQSCWWELDKLANHYHPSVALFADTILKGNVIAYSGDPLQDFNLIRFLDRFVYKNPKKMQDEGRKVHTSIGKRKHPVTDIKSIPIHSEEYLLKGEENIPVEEKFFYRYFNNRSMKAKAMELEDVDSDASSVSDNEFDDYIDAHEQQMDDRSLRGLDFDFGSDFSKYKSKKRRKGSDSDDDDIDLSDEEVDFDDDDDVAFPFPSADDDVDLE